MTEAARAIRLSATLRVGDLRIDALSDGAPGRRMATLFRDVPEAEWVSALGLASADEPVPYNTGSFLVRGDDHVTLIDTGWGGHNRASGAPGAGELLRRLDEVGVAPADVDVIIHTHLHGDHCGWDVNDDAGGTRTFPNATIHVARRELEFWTGADAAAIDRTPFIRSRIEPALRDGVLRTFDGEHIIGRAITMIPTPGHTPGHCSVVLASRNEHLVILGDAAHHPVHLERPDWIPAVDLDPDDSRRSRRAIADRAIALDAIVTGGHFPILTLGRVRRSGSRYHWTAVPE